MSKNKKDILTRDSILSGKIHEIVREEDSSMRLLTEEERKESLLSMFSDRKIDQDVWIFGYGSLIWNPAIHFERKDIMTIYGFHRKFCLKTYLGRGNKEAPGLVLALDHGGSCRGIAFKIPAKIAAHELEIIWRREMLSGSYIPKWLNGKIKGISVKALGFVINKQEDRYIGDLTDVETAALISKASGFLGTCSEYLINTSEHLEDLGIPDNKLSNLVKLL
ncbi:MAG: gamma-glutamylcyclotransferase [Rhodospirillaceae bacterium]|nr:gamma-glutamylcyclotransferase [Rhodospirillaceae bacterium]MDG1887028.1 gamma-glutamylcyclotransferase [Alphaproteobacteria bacterium]|tara:strand:- start:1008 stop:1670 length:663 start_codon:yes stop_codon:yes gene_type:complete